MSLAQSLARVDDGILIQGAFSLAGSSGGRGIEGSTLLATEELVRERLHEENKIYNGARTSLDTSALLSRKPLGLPLTLCRAWE